MVNWMVSYFLILKKEVDSISYNALIPDKQDEWINTLTDIFGTELNCLTHT